MRRPRTLKHERACPGGGVEQLSLVVGEAIELGGAAHCTQAVWEMNELGGGVITAAWSQSNGAF
jgi:hypothetical protein